MRQDIKTWLKQLPRFYCKDINDIEKENKNLESQLKVAKNELEDEK